MMTEVKLGKTLKELRTLLGVSQARFAEMAGVAEHTICLVESGSRAVHNSTLEPIAVALGVDASVIRLLSDDSQDPFVVKLQELGLRNCRTKVKYKAKHLLEQND